MPPLRPIFPTYSMHYQSLHQAVLSSNKVDLPRYST